MHKWSASIAAFGITAASDVEARFAHVKNISLPKRPRFIDRLCVYYLPILFVTVFAKLSVPPLGAKGIAIGVGIPLGISILRMLVSGDVELNSLALALFLTFLALIVGAPIMHGDEFSFPSVAFLFVLFFPLTIRFRSVNATYEDALSWFLAICTCVALAGLGQFLLQGLVPRKFLFPIENVVPDFLRVMNFATDTAVAYKSELYRVNGVFLLEPSFFSQLMAIAALGELCTRGRLNRIFLYLTAIVFSYSGTGVLVLVLVAPIFLIRHRRFDLLLYGLILVILSIALSNVLHLEIFLNRANSFTSTRSSAFARFVGGYYMLDDLVWPDVYRSMFGFGPGSFADLALNAHSHSAEMTLYKSLVEYGAVGSLFFFAFVGLAVFSSSAHLEVKMAIFLTLFLNGSYAPFFQPLALALAIWPRKNAPPESLPVTSDVPNALVPPLVT